MVGFHRFPFREEMNFCLLQLKRLIGFPVRQVSACGRLRVGPSAGCRKMRQFWRIVRNSSFSSPRWRQIHFKIIGERCSGPVCLTGGQAMTDVPPSPLRHAVVRIAIARSASSSVRPMSGSGWTKCGAWFGRTGESSTMTNFAGRLSRRCWAISWPRIDASELGIKRCGVVQFGAKS